MRVGDVRVDPGAVGVEAGKLHALAARHIRHGRAQPIYQGGLAQCVFAPGAQHQFDARKGGVNITEFFINACTSDNQRIDKIKEPNRVFGHIGANVAA